MSTTDETTQTGLFPTSPVKQMPAQYYSPKTRTAEPERPKEPEEPNQEPESDISKKDDYLVHTSKEDVKFKISVEGKKYKIQVIFKSEPVGEIIPSTTPFKERSDNRNKAIKEILILKCGMNKEEANKIILEMPERISEFEERLRIKKELWINEKAKEDSELEERQKLEREKAKSVIVAVDWNFNDKEIEISLKISFDVEQKLYVFELLFNGESVHSISSQIIDIPKLQQYAEQALNISSEQATELMKELTFLAQQEKIKIQNLNPEVAKENKYNARLSAIQQKDQYASIDRVGRKLYFGCYVPRGYFVGLDDDSSSYGVFKILKVTDEDGDDYYENVPICSIRIMITGRFKSLEGTDIVELTYIDNSDKQTIYAPLPSIIGTKEFKEILRPQNIRIDDFQLKDMIAFFQSCVNYNEREKCAAFKTGLAFDKTGWKDEACTKFNAGNRYFEDKNGVLEETRCIYTHEDTATVFDPRGSIEAWVKGISPLMVYDRVRFICYAGFAAILLKFLSVDSFTIDIYGGIPGADNDKSGSGKTTMTMIAVSGFGNVNPDSGSGNSLFNVCQSTNNYIENIATRFVDLALLLDESTLLSPEDREELGYRASSKTTKGRALDGKGNNQKQQRKKNVALVSGEEPLISSKGNKGSKIRSPGIRGGIGVSGIGSLVTDANTASKQNSGHLLNPFLAMFFKHRIYVKKWFEAARKRLEDSVTNDMAKRQASYFAAIETAGNLLELVFDKIGIEKKNPVDVVNNIWNESISSHPTQAAWKDALIDTWEWYHENSEIHFTPNITKELYGWKWSDKDGEYLELIKKSHVDTLLKKHPRNYDPDMTYESWKAAGLLNVTSQEDSPKLVTRSVKRYGESLRVIQINIKKLYELLEMEYVKDDW